MISILASGFFSLYASAAASIAGMLKLASHAATVNVFSSSEVYIAAALLSSELESSDVASLLPLLPHPTNVDIASTPTSNKETTFFFIKNPPLNIAYLEIRVSECL